MSDLAGQSAVITGGAGGIGLGIAEALARRGVRVLIADVDIATAETEAARLRTDGFDVAAHAVDVTEEASIAALADAAFARFGAVNFLFNNAGVGVPGPLEKLHPRNWDWAFAVNVHAIYYAARAFVPRMLASPAPAHIVNTASEHALGLPAMGGFITPYTATKHAVLGLTLGMRRDYAQTHLKVSVICPALVRSRIWKAANVRPAAFGGAREVDPRYGEQNAKGLDAAVAGERIVRQLEAGAFYIFTHGPDERGVAEEKAAEIAAAFAAFDALDL
ncbi:1-deoxy-11-beta-hydroxypentalenate dehydrogenase [Alphaproteobacteria bacterium SO-S41]|nr:1-deoxy-11-beta-hydroxypentalenate dehydrogenase [Alphaproteobacteria bacterium SO-S41]